MTLTFKQKDLFFSKDLTQYVAYKKNTYTALLDNTLSMFFVCMEADTDTPEHVKKAISKFFIFVKKTSKERSLSGNMLDNNILKCDLAHQHQYFYFDNEHKAFDFSPREFWDYIGLHKNVYHYKTLILQTFIPMVSDQDPIAISTPYS